jgi:hypothetical protein
MRAVALPFKMCVMDSIKGGLEDLPTNTNTLLIFSCASKNMNTAEQIYKHVKALPESTAREILDFVEFIAAKRKLVETGQSLSSTERLEKMRVARGLWAQRDDLPDIPGLRREWDRSFDSGES